MSDLREPAEAIARAFVDARKSGSALPIYPGEQPQTLDQAYAVQKQAIAYYDAPILGWKVGRIPDPVVEKFGINRLAGPIFENVIESVDGEPEMPIFAGGFGAAEAEYLLRIGHLPASFDRDWTNEGVAEYVDAVHVGLEIASSPFPEINEHGPAVTISDFGNNYGLVIGAEVPLGTDVLDWPVVLEIDGEVAGAAPVRNMLDGPYGAVRFLFEQARDRALPLAAGQWASTGAVTGVHQVFTGQKVEARFGDDYKVRCIIR